MTSRHSASNGGAKTKLALPEGVRPSAWRVPEACLLMGISRTTLYELVKRGEIRMIKIASRALVPDSEIQKLTSVESEAA